jgi:hypothetical protein
MKKILLLLIISTSIYGNQLLESFGSIGKENALTSRVSVSSANATYFNPALLPLLKNRTDVGFFILYQNLDITYKDRPDGSDVTDRIYDAKKMEPNGTTSPINYKPYPTQNLTSRGGLAPDNTMAYLSIGVTKEIISEKLFLGVTALIPSGSFMIMDPYFVDENEQYFSNSLRFQLYGDRMQNGSFSFAGAYFYKKFLSFGLGLTLSIASTADTQVYVDDVVEQKLDKMRPYVVADTNFVPYFAVLLKTSKNFFITSTVHLEYKNSIDIQTKTMFFDYENKDGDKFNKQGIGFTYYYEPLKVSLGFNWNILPDFLTIMTSVLYSRWSTYIDRTNKTPSDTWYDVISFNLGSKFTLDIGNLSFDLSYIPTPVPDQTGRTNYVDNTQIGFAFSWGKLFAFSFMKFNLSANMQFHYLIPRSVVKDLNRKYPVIDEFPDSVDSKTGEYIEDSRGFQSNNPGYPGFGSSGFIVAGGLNLSFEI